MGRLKSIFGKLFGLGTVGRGFVGTVGVVGGVGVLPPPDGAGGAFCAQAIADDSDTNRTARNENGLRCILDPHDAARQARRTSTSYACPDKYNTGESAALAG